jgi:aspartyl-tRNA(Asn)/glutamyl-tRNA(Gln) amidotransferase subunit C
MSVEAKDVRRIARLAHIAVDDSRLEGLAGELNAILHWVEQLGEVDVEGVQPMASAVGARLQLREDRVTQGGERDAVLSNAPRAEEGFFVVPKVVE